MGVLHKNMPATAIAQPTILYTEAIHSELLLRGLPWKSTVPEVVLLLLSKGFLVREQDDRMCKDRGGKANGRCVINTQSRNEAIAAQAVLHGQIWGKRYIEAFVKCREARTTCSAPGDSQFEPFGQMA